MIDSNGLRQAKLGCDRLLDLDNPLPGQAPVKLDPGVNTAEVID
jgi:hypothetical protein